jgi:amidase
MSLTREEYRHRDAVALAQLMRAGDATPAGLIDCAVAEIAAGNAACRAVIHHFPGHARAMVAHGLPTGPLSGVPYVVKDTGLQIAGTPISSGSKLFTSTVCAADDTLATRYARAGLLPLGRTNVPEFALSFTTEGEAHGPAANPWDLRRSTGGSSGGSAAAVAAGMVPIAHAADGAGSIRVPAAHCGVFGFKPSRMRNPMGPEVAEGNAGTSTPHVITRSVRDSATMLDISSGPACGDPYAVPPAPVSFRAVAERDPSRLRIGLVLESPLRLAIDPVCRQAAEQAAMLCQSLGHDVEPARCLYDAAEVFESWRVIAGTQLALRIGKVQALRPGIDISALIEPVNAALVCEGQGWSGMQYAGAIAALHRSSRAMGAFFERFDLLLSPVTARPAPLLGELAGRDKALQQFFTEFWEHAPFTGVFNTSGCPAMSVPLGWPEDADGRLVPVGVQFGAGFGNDALLFQIAGQLERAAPWAHRYAELTLRRAACGESCHDRH